MPRRPAERPAARTLFGRRSTARRFLTAAPLAGALLCPLSAPAQDEPVADPSAAGQPAAAATGAAEIDAPNPLAAEPGTVEEFVSAAARLRRVARPGLARRYLRTLLDSQPSDDALLEARDALGPAIFFELAADPQLRPEGQTLQDRVREAVLARGADPARLDGLIDALIANQREREAATEALTGLGAAATPRLTERLVASVDAVTGDADLTEAITRLLGRLRGLSVPPLTAVLRSPQAPAAARAAVAAALGTTGSQEALDALLTPAFAPDETPSVQLAAQAGLLRLTDGDSLRGLADAAADRLKQRAETLLSDPPAIDSGAADVPLYRYDAAENRLIPAPLAPAVAGRYRAATAAAGAARIAPHRENLHVLELTAALAYEASLAGRGQFLPRGEGTVHRAALSAGSTRLLKALQTALDLGASDAAAAALQVLLDVPTPDLLRPVGGGGSPVVQALRSPAAEVRFLAALLAARANPGPSFTEGAEVVAVFAGALTDAPGGQAVVIDPNPERGSRMAGLLQGFGYRVDLSTSARDGFQRAASGSGADLVAIQANVPDFPVSSLVANLRADARTRAVPLVLYGSERLEPPLSAIANRAGEAVYTEFPVAAETLERRIAPLRQVAEPLPDDLKAEQKRAAAYALSRLAAGDGRTFPLGGAVQELSAAVSDPTVSANVSVALAAIPDAAAQGSLAETLTVVRPGPDAELAAADALTQSVRRYGSLLSDDVVDALRRQAAAAQDPQVRDALLTLSAALPDAEPPLPPDVTLPVQAAVPPQ
ncbi:response regulator [Alienimonas californiensis]|uniref:Response regulatory domain-containing protein n=1 Tax=Alienimonas californiensis TaxID=2527989 RepID=A0A517PCQ3_9PLAN|nr:hypothetical protein [Alienimonas californiensis]QDT17146.1 hypothetical protein CA12_32580 [Alienimonas californiensis]